MDHMRKRALALLGVSALLVSLCCACVEGKPSAEDTTQDVNVKTLKTEAYSLVLPEPVTAEEGEDGALTLFLDGKEVGGVQVIFYEDAEDLDINEIDTEEGRAKFNELLSLLSPEGKEAHMFSTHEDTFCLSLFPETEEDPVESIHYFFPKGDVFYVLFFQRDGSLSETEQQVILDSFVLAS